MNDPDEWGPMNREERREHARDLRRRRKQKSFLFRDAKSGRLIREVLEDGPGEAAT